MDKDTSVFNYIPSIGHSEPRYNDVHKFDFINLIMPSEDMEWLKRVKDALTEHGYEVNDWDLIGLENNRLPVTERYLNQGYDVVSNSAHFLNATMKGDSFVLKIELHIFFSTTTNWVISYSWDYPFQERMDAILEPYTSYIACKAFDGEEYSGVLLGGNDWIPFANGSLYWLCYELPETIKEIVTELDRRLT